jgi:hypothetical protein
VLDGLAPVHPARIAQVSVISASTDNIGDLLLTCSLKLPWQSPRHA